MRGFGLAGAPLIEAREHQFAAGAPMHPGRPHDASSISLDDLRVCGCSAGVAFVGRTRGQKSSAIQRFLLGLHAQTGGMCPTGDGKHLFGSHWVFAPFWWRFGAKKLSEKHCRLVLSCGISSQQVFRHLQNEGEKFRGFGLRTPRWTNSAGLRLQPRVKFAPKKPVIGLNVPASQLWSFGAQTSLSTLWPRYIWQIQPS